MLLKKTKPKLFGVRKNKVEEELNAQESPTYGEDTPPSSLFLTSEMIKA